MDELPEGDYTLTDGRAWLTVEGFSVWVRKTDDGIVVEVFEVGREADTNPLAGCQAHDADLGND